MKIYLIAIILVFIAVQGKSQEETHKISEKEVEINHSMIEKFKNYEYSNNQMSVFDNITNYSFEEAKLIIYGYGNDEFDLTSTDKITAYLSEVQKQMDKSQMLVKNAEENKLELKDLAANSY